MLVLFTVCTLATLAPGYLPLSEGPVTVDLPRSLLEAQQDNWTYSLFVIERTITIEVKDFPDTTGAEFIVWETSRRHTSANTVVPVERTVELNYRYYFDPTEDIVIFDRRPNTPIWYGIAVGATVIACAVFYLIVKKKRTAGELTQGQYQYHDSSH